MTYENTTCRAYSFDSDREVYLNALLIKTAWIHLRYDLKELLSTAEKLFLG